MNKLIIKNHEASVEINGIDYPKNDLYFQVFYNKDIGIRLKSKDEVIYREKYDEIDLYNKNGNKMSITNIDDFKATLRTFFFRKLTNGGGSGDGGATDASELSFASTSGNIVSSNVQDAIEEVYAAIPSQISINSAKDVPFENEDTGISSTDVHDALLEIDSKIGSGEAKDIAFEPITGVTAQDNVQDALEEIYNTIDSLDASVVSFEDGSEDGLEATTVEEAILEVNSKVDDNNNFLLINEYDDSNIPSLIKGQEIDFVIDDGGHTYRYKVLKNTAAGDTPYTNPDKFKRIGMPRGYIELKGSCFTTSTKYLSYSSITYTHNEINYLAICVENAVLIYNLDSLILLQTIAGDNMLNLFYNDDVEKLYITTGTNKMFFVSPDGTNPININFDTDSSIISMTNIQKVGLNKIAFFATSNTMIYAFLITLNADGTAMSVENKTMGYTNIVIIISCKFVEENKTLYSSVQHSNSGNYRNHCFKTIINDDGSLSNIEKVFINNPYFSNGLMSFANVEVVGNYLYFNTQYCLIRTKLDLSEPILISLSDTSLRYMDDIYSSNITYVKTLNKLVVSRYTNITEIRGYAPMIIYQLDIKELEALSYKDIGSTIVSLKKSILSEMPYISIGSSLETTLSGVDEIKHHFLVSNKQNNTLKLYKY